jgi:hypothetical protein
MAIVKLKYTRSRHAIKAHLRYIIHRPQKEREKVTRELFHHNYLSVTKQNAYDLIDAAPKGTVFYKMTINFHPVKEDTHKDLDLHSITSLTVREMQSRIGRNIPFIATIHNGHENTDLRHIHAICLVQGRLSKEEFAKLRTLWQSVSAEVRVQRRIRDRAHYRSRTRFLTQAHVLYQSSARMERDPRYPGGRRLRLQHGCYHCGYGHFEGIPGNRQYCPRCHKPLNQEKILHLELDRQL